MEGCVDRKLLSNARCFVGTAFVREHERYTKVLELLSSAIRRAFDHYDLKIHQDDNGPQIHE